MAGLAGLAGVGCAAGGAAGAGGVCLRMPGRGGRREPGVGWWVDADTDAAAAWPWWPTGTGAESIETESTEPTEPAQRMAVFASSASGSGTELLMRFQSDAETVAAAA